MLSYKGSSDSQIALDCSNEEFMIKLRCLGSFSVANWRQSIFLASLCCSLLLQS